MRVFFCHGLEGSPLGRKVQALRAAGHEVIAPELPREDFSTAVRLAETTLRAQPVDCLIGSSRGGAIVMRLGRNRTLPMVLLAPAWRRNNVEPVVGPTARIIHGIKDDIVPLADSIELEERNQLPPGYLLPVNDNHRLSSSLGLAALLRAAGDLEVIVAERSEPRTGTNQIFTIKPYLWEGVWVFDDAARGLNKEALVAGMPEIIERATAQAGISNPERGFVAIFSKDPFPGAMLSLEWVREEMGGNIYRWGDAGMEGWLCPALFRYFDTAPQRIYLAIQARR